MFYKDIYIYSVIPLIKETPPPFIWFVHFKIKFETTLFGPFFNVGDSS